MKTPLIGDHLMLILHIPSKIKEPSIRLKHSWKIYTKEILITELMKVNFNPEPNDPQTYWNMKENILLSIIDKLAPKVPFLNNVTTKSTKPNKYIKSKLNL